MTAQHVVVIGASVAGLSSALALSNRGHRVTLLEQEVLPHCETPLEAFELWERPGSPQSRHSHAFLARLHNDIKENTPEFYASLLEAGATTLPFSEMTREFFPDEPALPGDEQLTLLACRRITFDWTLKRHVERHTQTEYRDGITVVGLEATRDEETGLPRVTGLRARNRAGEVELIEADLVVDASGRNTKLGSWLEGIGAETLEQESERCGIFYCSRFYRILEGIETPAMEGPIGADLGYMKYAIFLGDSRVFSITLAASPDDEVFRQVRRHEVFEAATRCLPATRRWVDPAISEPITDVYTYANLKNTLRFFFRDDRPLALGIYPVGDAQMHQNPITGRGCTVAWIGAHLLADAYTENAGNLLTFARAHQADNAREFFPWYYSMRDQDRGSREIAHLEAKGAAPFAYQREDGSVDPKAYMRSLLRDGLIPSLREDITVLRAFMRVFNLLDSPSDLLTQPGLLQRVLEVWQRREEHEPIALGPTRAEMLAELKRAAA